MKNFRAPNVLKLFLSFVLVYILVYCESDSDLDPSENYTKTEIGSLLWVNEFHSDSAVKEAVKQMLDNSSIVIAQVSWSPGDSSFFENVLWYYNLAKDHHKKFMLSIDWQNFERTGTQGNWSFANDTVQARFRSDMIKLVDEYSPDYFQPGVEINYYGLTNSEGYKGFIKVFNELKTELNFNYQSTKIGLSFQLELLFGVHKDWDKNRTLATLDAVAPNLDFIGVSTYPDEFEHYKENVTGSLKYLDSLNSNYENSMIISETAVSSFNFNPQVRIKYQNTLFDKARKLKFKALIWGSIIDHKMLTSWQYKIGLLNSNGAPKADFENWKKRSQELKPIF